MILMAASTYEEFEDKLENASNKFYPQVAADLQNEISSVAIDATQDSPKEIHDAIMETVHEANDSIQNMVKTEMYFTPNPTCWQDLYKNEIQHAKDTLKIVKDLSKESVDAVKNKANDKVNSLEDAASTAIMALKKIPEQLARESNRMELSGIMFRKMNEEMKRNIQALEKLKKEAEDKELATFYDKIIADYKLSRQMMSKYFSIAKDREREDVHPFRMSEYLDSAKQAYTSTLKSTSAYMTSVRSSVKNKSISFQKKILQNIRRAFDRCNSFLKNNLMKVKKEVRNRIETGKKVYTEVSQLRPALSINVGVVKKDMKNDMVDKYINTERTKPIEQMLHRMAKSGMTNADIQRQKAAFLEGVSKAFDAAVKVPEVKKIVASNELAMAR